MQRVAITGVGIISCLGTNRQVVGEALRRGKSGVVIDETRKQLGFRSPLTGKISGFIPHPSLSKKQQKTMPEFAVQTYSAVMEALDQAGLEPEDLQNEGTGLLFGCDSSCQACVDQVRILQAEGETKAIGSGLIFRSMTSTITMNLNTLLKTRGICLTISSACSSGGHAVGLAADLIALGRQERIICGGAQEINWESMCSFDGLGAFSLRTDRPESASRPFDRNRDGLVPSGGAAAIVLESFEAAKKRGARILGEVLTYAFSSDGNHISIPSPDGLTTCMAQALRQAGLKAQDIDYICAHATSTPVGDAVEAGAIKKIFDGAHPWISSLKSMTGHELWMSGAAQVVYSVIMAEEGFIAPNINFERPDPGFEDLKIPSEAVNRPPRTVLCNSAGFGGTNSCLVLRFGR
jgi:3-oxoacyl-[acyl-carrier-protein] synthase-1